jgi:hypothetical protein
MGRAGRPGAGKRRIFCPHAGIDSGGAKPAADLCEGTGQLLARQAHGQLSTGGQVGAALPGAAGAQQCWQYRCGTRQSRGGTSP